MQMARKNAATEENIRHSWQKSGLFPIKPQLILDKLGLQVPQTDSELSVPIASNGDSISIPMTPANTKQVDQLVAQIKAGNHDPALPEKLGKACNLALANGILLNHTNNDLIKADERKKDKAKRGQANWGEARIMNMDVVQQRKDDHANKQFKQECRNIGHLGPALFKDDWKRSPTKKSPTKKSPTKKSSTKKKTTVLATPGPLTPFIFAPPQIPPQTSLQTPSKALSQQQQRGGGRGRGKRGRGSQRGRGGSRSRVVEEKVVEEEAVPVFSRSGRPIRPKKR